MRLLVCLPAYRYGDPRCIEPHYDWFVETPRRMGHEVRLFNTARWHRIERDGLNEELLETVKRKKYDLTLALPAVDEFDPEVLQEVRKHTFLAAWNSDDDWRWDDYSRKLYPYFDRMVTTYRRVYDAKRSEYPNLVLSQWACLSTFDGMSTPKVLPICFVGLRYGRRAEQVQELRRAAPVHAYGTGFGGRLGDDGSLVSRCRRQIAGRLRLQPAEDPLSFAEINAVWARSRIAFTPLEASTGTSVQIKSRVFDMGLSGTLMLCTRNPELDEYYTRGAEYEDYESMQECRDKATFYLGNEAARSKIAEAYYARTKSAHLWEHRLTQLFRDLDVPGYR